MRSNPVDCSFNPKRDIKEVENGMAVSIDDMLRTGIVKDSGEDLSHNDIDDPESIIGLVRDEFAAIDAQRAIKKYGKKSASAVKEAAKEAAAVTDSKPAE